MAFDFSKVIIDEPIAGGTSNFYFGSPGRIKYAIEKDSDFKSSTVNTLLYKLSDTINFFQRNGCTSYILGKKYKLNNIVTVLFYNPVNSAFQSTMLKCIATNNEDLCDVIPNINYTVNDAGNIIFNDNNWDTNYWEELTKNGLNEFNLELSEFEFNYNISSFSRDNSQVKSVELFDFSKVPANEFKYLNFSVTTNRYNNIFMNCVVSGNMNKVKLEVQTINNNVNAFLVNNSNIWYSNSIFKDIAYDGMFFSVDEVNKKVYLHYLGAEVMNKDKFDINIKINKGSVDILLAQVNLADFIDNNDYVIVPFIKNASNEFSDRSYKLYDYAYQLDTKEIFKNGLKEVESETGLDTWLYPITRKLKNINFRIYELYGRYKLTNSDQERYKEPLFPNLKGEADGSCSDNATVTGVYRKENKVSHTAFRGRHSGGSRVDVIIGKSDTSGTRYFPFSYEENQRLKFIYKDIDPTTGNTTGWKLRPELLEARNVFNSKVDEPDRLTTASFKTFAYIKLW